MPAAQAEKAARKKREHRPPQKSVLVGAGGVLDWHDVLLLEKRPPVVPRPTIILRIISNLDMDALHPPLTLPSVASVRGKLELSAVRNPQKWMEMPPKIARADCFPQPDAMGSKRSCRTHGSAPVNTSLVRHFLPVPSPRVRGSVYNSQF